LSFASFPFLHTFFEKSKTSEREPTRAKRDKQNQQRHHLQETQEVNLLKATELVCEKETIHMCVNTASTKVSNGFLSLPIATHDYNCFTADSDEHLVHRTSSCRKPSLKYPLVI